MLFLGCGLVLVCVNTIYKSKPLLTWDFMADALASRNHTSGRRLVVHEKVRGGAANIIQEVSQSAVASIFSM